MTDATVWSERKIWLYYTSRITEDYLNINNKFETFSWDWLRVFFNTSHSLFILSCWLLLSASLLSSFVRLSSNFPSIQCITFTSSGTYVYTCYWTLNQRLEINNDWRVINKHLLWFLWEAIVIGHAPKSRIFSSPFPLTLPIIFKFRLLRHPSIYL